MIWMARVRVRCLTADLTQQQHHHHHRPAAAPRLQPARPRLICAAGMQDDAESSSEAEGDGQEAPAGPSGDQPMEDDSIQEFEGHAGEQPVAGRACCRRQCAAVCGSCRCSKADSSSTPAHSWCQPVMRMPATSTTCRSSFSSRSLANIFCWCVACRCCAGCCLESCAGRPSGYWWPG